MKCLVRAFALLLVLTGSITASYGNPKARDFLKRGEIQLGKKNLAKAIRNYTKTIKVDPFFAEAYVRRGIALQAKGSLTAAIQTSRGPRRLIRRRLLTIVTSQTHIVAAAILS